MMISAAGQSIEILYEDNHLLAVVKPAGILSQADGRNVPDMLSHLRIYLKEKYHKPGDAWLGLVHRLDQPVSGVMIFAKTSKAAARLSDQIRRHRMEKYYFAVVAADVEPLQGECRDYLQKNEKTGHVHVVKDAAAGKLAYLHYRKLQTVYADDRPCSLLFILLGSGRSHQIRVQLSHRGWPILGDGRYGGICKNPDSSGKESLYSAVEIDGQMHADLALHACLLLLEHPVRNVPAAFQSRPPAQMPWLLFDIPDPVSLSATACSPGDL